MIEEQKPKQKPDNFALLIGALLYLATLVTVFGTAILIWGPWQ